MDEPEGNRSDTLLFRYNDQSGRGVVVRLTEAAVQRDAKLKELVNRVKKLPVTPTYGEHYEKGPHHDKEYDKGGGHDKSFSRT